MCLYEGQRQAQSVSTLSSLQLTYCHSVKKSNINNYKLSLSYFFPGMSEFQEISLPWLIQFQNIY